MNNKGFSSEVQNVRKLKKIQPITPAVWKLPIINIFIQFPLVTGCGLLKAITITPIIIPASVKRNPANNSGDE